MFIVLKMNGVECGGMVLQYRLLPTFTV